MDFLLDPRLRADASSNIPGPNVLQRRDRDAQQHSITSQRPSAASYYKVIAQSRTKTHPHLVAMMDEIAMIYGSWDWDSKTRNLENNVVRSCEKALHEGNTDAIATLDDLVSLYVGQGRSREAVELEKRVIDMYISLFGEGHEYTLTAMEGLMATYGIQGRSSEREELRERIMVARMRL